MFGDEDNVMASIEAGALGYIHKDATPEDIAQTILDMKDGASPISPMIARHVLSQFRSRRARPASQVAVPAPSDAQHQATEPPAEAAKPTERPQLSSREQEVLELIARGFSYAEIARIKNISVHTVQTHIKNLYKKLAVRTRVQVVKVAQERGLI